MISFRIKIPSRYTTRTTTRTMTRIPRFCHFTDVCHHLRMSVISRMDSAVFAHYTACVYRYRIDSAVLHMSAAYTAPRTLYCMCVSISDLLCPFNMSVIDSAVFAHVNSLYSMCGVCIDRFHRFYTCRWSLYRYRIDSAVLHMCVSIGSAHLICLSSIPPFLRTIQLVYTACVYRYRLCSFSMSVIGSTIFAHVCIDIG